MRVRQLFCRHRYTETFDYELGLAPFTTKVTRTFCISCGKQLKRTLEPASLLVTTTEIPARITIRMTDEELQQLRTSSELSPVPLSSENRETTGK